MSDEILVNATPMETRIAIVENGILQELFIERSNHRGLIGNIYRGKVVRVLPGMQAAFVDIGLDRTAFLHATEFHRVDTDAHDIRSLVWEGQYVDVQIVKDPIGSKGAKITAKLSISSRYLVYMPTLDEAGISQRIEEDNERQRLKEMVLSLKSQHFERLNGHFIVRTAAESVSLEDMEADMLFLNKLWGAIKEAKPQDNTHLIYEDLPVYHRILRDLMCEKYDRIRVDSRETLQRMTEFSGKFSPEIEKLLEWYPGERPIFELYGIEDDIQRGLSRRVDLKSGGYLIFDQTEAMTTIDVNTGAFVGCRNLEETIFKTNLEAAMALARQLRVRNLGGIIIVDFIDMQDVNHQNQVLRTLERALAKDLTKTAISGVTELGLVQIVRKRTRESLEQMLSETCDVCQGRGMIKSLETVCYEIFRAILRESRAYNHDAYLVLASQLVIDYLLDEESANVAEVELFIGKSIEFQLEPAYSQEIFDVIPQ
jgi:ribonuclease G